MRTRSCEKREGGIGEKGGGRGSHCVCVRKRGEGIVWRVKSRERREGGEEIG